MRRKTWTKTASTPTIRELAREGPVLRKSRVSAFRRIIAGIQMVLDAACVVAHVSGLRIVFKANGTKTACMGTYYDQQGNERRKVEPYSSNVNGEECPLSHCVT